MPGKKRKKKPHESKSQVEVEEKSQGPAQDPQIGDDAKVQGREIREPDGHCSLCFRDFLRNVDNFQRVVTTSRRHGAQNPRPQDILTFPGCKMCARVKKLSPECVNECEIFTFLTPEGNCKTHPLCDDCRSNTFFNTKLEEVGTETNDDKVFATFPCPQPDCSVHVQLLGSYLVPLQFGQTNAFYKRKLQAARTTEFKAGFEQGYQESEKNGDTLTRQQAYDMVVSACTAKCPGCNQAFVYDACLAVTCECESTEFKGQPTRFCAVCGDTFETNDKVHEHCSRCKQRKFCSHGGQPPDGMRSFELNLVCGEHQWDDQIHLINVIRRSLRESTFCFPNGDGICRNFMHMLGNKFNGGALDVIPERVPGLGPFRTRCESEESVNAQYVKLQLLRLIEKLKTKREIKEEGGPCRSVDQVLVSILEDVKKIVEPMIGRKIEEIIRESLQEQI